MPSLPLDLERMIFELAATQDTDHDNRVRITLVAKRVYEWIRPILYRVAIAEALHSATIQSWRKAQRTDVAPFVRHLCLIRLREESIILELLSTFRNVENLAIRGKSISCNVLKGIDDLPLHTLSVDLGQINLDEAIKNCNAFQNLTHLDLFDLEGQSWKDWNLKALVELPKLTHLCFFHFSEVEDEVILRLLECCSSLQVMLVCGGMLEADFDYVPVEPVTDDPRYLVFQDKEVEDLRDWERSANGQVGLWELADIIVEARKGKLFVHNLPFFFRATWMDDLNDDGVRWYRDSRGCNDKMHEM